MKVLLTALNAKYVHTNLAVRYLSKTVSSHVEDVKIREFTINHSPQYIVSEIFKERPDVLCFSCYIWNISIIHSIIRTIKKVMPDTVIILGGPEVSFETKMLMETNDAIDIVIMGEGENIFPQLIQSLKKDDDYSGIEGIAFRARGQVFINDNICAAMDMENIPFPYSEEILDKDKIIYYESSRGCPFNCQYCLSSSFQGVRFLPLKRVKEELKFFIDQEVKQVKFVDRTFNANKVYAMEIMKFISKYSKGKTNFHFEITADLLDDEMLDFLSRAEVGLFQFEIGVQSTNEETLKAIHRKMNFAQLSRTVRKVSSGRNIHQHLDLIVGLPKEDYFSFRKSFDDVFALRPEKLQVGFLKLLKGSGLRIDAAKYGYVFNDEPPYEVLESDSLTYGEIIRLKGLEEMVETYWNTGMFNSSIELILQNFYSSSFRFFEVLWEYWQAKGYHHISHSKNRLYEILLEFYLENQFDRNTVFMEVLKFDFLKNTKTTSLPSFLSRRMEDQFKHKCHEFLQRQENLEAYLPSYIGMPAKQIIKKVHFEQFLYDVVELDKDPKNLQEIREKNITVLFDYSVENKAIDYCRYFVIDIG